MADSWTCCVRYVMNTSNCRSDNKFEFVQFDFYFIYFLEGVGMGDCIVTKQWRLRQNMLLLCFRDGIRD